MSENEDKAIEIFKKYIIDNYHDFKSISEPYLSKIENEIECIN